MCNGRHKGFCGNCGDKLVGESALRRVGQYGSAAEHVAADDLTHPVGLLEDRAVRGFVFFMASAACSGVTPFMIPWD
jgi:sugar/nucleoside kinase (ribokinase family)